MALGGSTLSLDIGLPSFSPTPGYPSFDLHRHVALVRAVQDGLPPFDHRLLQPFLSFFSLIYVNFGYELIVADEYRHGPRKLASRFLQEGV